MQVFHSKSTRAIRPSEGSNELHTFLPGEINGREMDGPWAWIASRGPVGAACRARLAEEPGTAWPRQPRRGACHVSVFTEIGWSHSIRGCHYCLRRAVSTINNSPALRRRQEGPGGPGAAHGERASRPPLPVPAGDASPRPRRCRRRCRCRCRRARAEPPRAVRPLPACGKPPV